MEDVLQDTLYSHQLIKSGGIILFDDAGYDRNRKDHVMGAINKFFSEHSTEYKILLDEYQFMIQKL